MLALRLMAYLSILLFYNVRTEPSLDSSSGKASAEQANFIEQSLDSVQHASTIAKSKAHTPLSSCSTIDKVAFLWKNFDLYLKSTTGFAILASPIFLKLQALLL